MSYDRKKADKKFNKWLKDRINKVFGDIPSTKEACANIGIDYDKIVKEREEKALKSKKKKEKTNINNSKQQNEVYEPDALEELILMNGFDEKAVYNCKNSGNDSYSSSSNDSCSSDYTSSSSSSYSSSSSIDSGC